MENADIETRRKQRLQEALFTADLNYEHIPIEVEGCGVSSSVEEVSQRVDKLETRMGMVEQSVASIDTILIGRDGKGGAIERLESGQKELREIFESATKEIVGSVKALSNLHVADINDLNTKNITFEHAVNEANESADDSKKKIEHHLEEHKTTDEKQAYKKYARQWDLFKTVISVILGAAVTIGLFFLFGIGG